MRGYCVTVDLWHIEQWITTHGTSVILVGVTNHNNPVVVPRPAMSKYKSEGHSCNSRLPAINLKRTIMCCGTGGAISYAFGVENFDLAGLAMFRFRFARFFQLFRRRLRLLGLSTYFSASVGMLRLPPVCYLFPRPIELHFHQLPLHLLQHLVALLPVRFSFDHLQLQFLLLVQELLFATFSFCFLSHQSSGATVLSY